MNATCVYEKSRPLSASPFVAHQHEDEIARHWWALPLDVSFPLSNGGSFQLLYAGRPGGPQGPDVLDAVLRFTNNQHSATRPTTPWEMSRFIFVPPLGLLTGIIPTIPKLKSTHK